METWQELAVFDGAALGAARVELHHAVQCIAAAGNAVVPRRADDSQGSLCWSDEVVGFVGEPLPPGGGRVALRVSGLALELRDARDRVVAELSLAGHTLAEAMEWLSARLASVGGARLALAMPTYPPDFADHPLAHVQPFGAPPATVELGRYYSNARRVLMPIAGAAPVRCWPHHFDIAVLLVLGESRSIGVGLSPGDGTFAEPYWYVTPWPYPAAPALPVLPSEGTWHTEGWTGAVLPASRFAGRANQEKRVRDFVTGAIGACRELLG